MSEQEQGYRDDINRIIENWENSDGFGNTDELECFEEVYALANAFMAGYSRKDFEDLPELTEEERKVMNDIPSDAVSHWAKGEW